MALIFHDGFESEDFMAYTSTIGSPTIQGVTKHTGNQAMKVASGDNGYARLLNWQGKSGSVYFRFSAAPNGGDLRLLYTYGDSRNGSYWRHGIELNTSRQLEANGTAGSTTLDVDTWYRVSWYALADELYVYLNGSAECNGTTAGFAATPLIDIGPNVDRSVDVYFDDLVIGDSTIAPEGDIRVARASPSGVGSANAYDTSSGFGNVDEIPANDADFIEDNQGNPARESYAIPDLADLAGASSGDTINAVSLWTRGDRDGGGATDHMGSLRDNGSYYNTANYAFNSIAWFNTYYAVMPDDSAAWLEARFNTLEIGAYHSGPQDQRQHCIVLMVAYTPAAAPPVRIPRYPAVNFQVPAIV